MMPNLHPFKPAWWLKNSHAQTMWPTLFRRAIDIDAQWERVELPDGDFVDLVWDRQNAADFSKPIILILPGLAGDFYSPYVCGLMKAISNHNWRPVMMHFRGCSGEPNRLPRGYHSGDTKDAAFVVEHLKNLNPHAPLGAVGISIGGNVLLKWLGETGSSNPLQGVVAVSVPFVLAAVADKFNQGLSQIYQYRLLTHIKSDMRKKFKKIPCPFDIRILDKISDFWEFDDKITAPLHGFRDVHHYYQDSSSKNYLKNVAKPVLIIHAKDDPFMIPEIIPTEREMSSSIHMELSEQGGHVGFIHGSIPGWPQYWLDERIPRFFTDLFEGK